MRSQFGILDATYSFSRCPWIVRYLITADANPFIKASESVGLLALPASNFSWR